MDFVPQSFAIALMSVLVPGVLTKRRLAAQGVEPLAVGRRPPRSLPVRAMLLAVLAALVGLSLAVATNMIVTAVTLSWLTGASVKIGHGVLVAAIVTPLGLRAVLADPAHQRDNRSR